MNKWIARFILFVLVCSTWFVKTAEGTDVPFLPDNVFCMLVFCIILTALILIILYGLYRLVEAAIP